MNLSEMAEMKIYISFVFIKDGAFVLNLVVRYTTQNTEISSKSWFENFLKMQFPFYSRFPVRFQKFSHKEIKWKFVILRSDM